MLAAGNVCPQEGYVPVSLHDSRAPSLSVKIKVTMARGVDLFKVGCRCIFGRVKVS